MNIYEVLVFSKEKVIFRVKFIDLEKLKINVAISDLMLKQETQNFVLRVPLTHTYLRKMLIEKMKKYIEDKLLFAFVLVDVDKLSLV